MPRFKFVFLHVFFELSPSAIPHLYHLPPFADEMIDLEGANSQDLQAASSLFFLIFLRYSFLIYLLLASTRLNSIMITKRFNLSGYSAINTVIMRKTINSRITVITELGWI
jgi:hypothetical protein